MTQRQDLSTSDHGRNMNSSEMDDKELTKILKSTADDLMLDYYMKCADLLAKLGIWSELEGQEGIPLEIWTTLAQVLADASGYRLALQATILQPSPDQINTWHTIGYREIAVVEPTHFVKES